MLSLNRDPAFWEDVCSHPMVRDTLLGLEPSEIGQLVQNTDILPLASVNGGFILCPLGGFLKVFELHTLFKPEGWGREVTLAAQEGLSEIFKLADLIVTYETADNPRSKPPKSVGFRETGDFSNSPIGSIRTWILSRSAWMASPVGRRVECPLQHH